MEQKQREATRKRRLTHPVHGLPDNYSLALLTWRFRQRLGLTIADVQRLSGLSKKHIIDVEAGRGTQEQLDNLQAVYNEISMDVATPQERRTAHAHAD